MDNLTHSAIGLIVGETVVRVLKKPGLRTPVLLASVMGNNIPDLDVLYTAITEAPYGNLLHHRGHTHTFAFAIPLAGLIVAVVRWWQKKKATESGLLFGVAAFGVCTHIIADWWNSYGVHPFWPADNHWYSGDMIFIIEPWLWLIMGPFLFSAAQGRIQKVFAGLLLVLAAICVWAVPVLPWLIVLFATLFGLAWFFLARRLKARERLITCWAFLVVLWATFGLTSNAVQKDIELFVRNSTPTSKIDVIVTPFPADPTCWYAIVAHLDGDVYTARSGVVSAWPSIRSVMSCQEKMLDWGEGCAPKVPSDWKDSEQFVWRGKFVGSRSEMERLRRNQCEVETFLQFSRAPYWVKVQDQGKETFLLGDLRFDRAKGMRWSKATVGELKECPRNRPPWIGPRLDWFGGETWNKDIGRSS